MENPRRVVITGIGIVSPLGLHREESWKNLCEGVSGATVITAFDASTWPTRFSCEVKNFLLPPNVISEEFHGYLNRCSRFGVTAAQEALADSQILEKMNPQKIGISIGVNVGSITPLKAWSLLSPRAGSSSILVQESDPVHASQTILCNHPSTLAGVMASHWNLHGPMTTVQTACASSAQAIGSAFRTIQRGEADAMLVGGADSLSGELLLAGFCLIGALSTRNDCYETASRPFDRDRDGFVAGEGAAMLILETLEHAQNRNAHIYAEISAYGETESAYRITDLPPDGRGIFEAMNDALKEAQLSPSDVDYINAHGTATQLNDRIELMAIERLYACADKAALVTSTKSSTGHLISAAGAIELAFSALSLRDQIIPATINLENPEHPPGIEIISAPSRSARIRAVISNSVGFGGSNASVLLKAFSEDGSKR